MKYLEPVDYLDIDFVKIFDELPLWSAPFGLMLLEKIPLRRGSTILDVGAGTGFLSIELAQRLGVDAKVIAVDPWTAAMQSLREKIAYLKLTNLTVINGDAASLELEDESVDVIVSNLGINNFDNVDLVLKECHRVSKPGGHFLLTTNLSGHMEEFYQIFGGVIRSMKLFDSIAPLNAHVDKRGTVKTVQQILEHGGFECVNAIEDTFFMRYVDGTSFLNHFFIRVAFLQDWVALIAPSRVEEVFFSLELQLNKFAEKNNGLKLTIPYVCIEARKK